MSYWFSGRRARRARSRNHNGYFVRWDGEGLLFDTGERTPVADAEIRLTCIRL